MLYGLAFISTELYGHQRIFDLSLFFFSFFLVFLQIVIKKREPLTFGVPEGNTGFSSRLAATQDIPFIHQSVSALKIFICYLTGKWLFLRRNDLSKNSLHCGEQKE